MLKAGKLSCLPKTLLYPVRFSGAVTQTKIKSFEEVPGPAKLPIVGSSWKYFPVTGEFDVKKLGAVAQTLYNRYGPIVRQKSGPINVVHLYDPRDFETIYKLCQQTGIHMRASFSIVKEFREAKPHLYNTVGLLAEQGDKWWSARKVTQKSVSPPKAVRTYLSQDDEIITEFVGKIGRMGRVDDYLSFANRLNMELTMMFLFGERYHNFDYSQPNQSKALNYILSFFDTATYLDRGDFYWTFPSEADRKGLIDEMEFIEKFTLEQIEKVKNRNDPEDTCIVAQLLRDPEFHPQEVGSIIDMLYAGIDTTAVTSTCLLHELGTNKRVQDKMREEAVKLLPLGRESKLTAETLRQAPYVKAVLRENFRLSPIITIQNRQLPESVELGGYLIPKGTLAILEIYASCRLESNFKDPLVFKPERWLKSSEEYEETHPYSMLHFGLGLRTCIARRRAEQILQIIFLRILSEYEVSHNGQNLELVTTSLLKPSQPVNYTFTKKT